MRVYVMIEQGRALAVVYRRQDSGFERQVIEGLNAVIPLPEIDAELALRDVYDGIDFAAIDAT